MNKDIINLIITIVMSTIGVVSTIYHNPVIGIIVFALGIVAYLAYAVYVVYAGVEGNRLIRMLPMLILLVVGGTIYWFWPSSLLIAIYEDSNNNGFREAGEAGISNEPIELIDRNFIPRPLVTDNNGRVSLPKIVKGNYRLKVRNFTVLEKARRGRNSISIGFIPQDDVTRPQTRIFLGEELGYPSPATYMRKVYAHLWFQDNESDIKKIEIDWGDGRGWVQVDRDYPTMNYYIYEHEYKKIGKKMVKFRVENGNGLSSIPSNEPPRPGYDYFMIDVRKMPSDAVGGGLK